MCAIGMNRAWVPLAVAFACLFATAPVASAGEADPAPFREHDAGGFRNVLPPGQNGTANAVDLVANTLDGALPPHWADQQPLYEGLMYASAKPGFGMAEVKQYYKDASFGVRPTQVESVTSPRAGVTIVRDSAYGVPHIYGVT